MPSPLFPTPDGRLCAATYIKSACRLISCLKQSQVLSYAAYGPTLIPEAARVHFPTPEVPAVLLAPVSLKLSAPIPIYEP